MAELVPPRMNKWPFLAGDLLLLLLAVVILYRSSLPLSGLALVSVVFCVVAGAILLIVPFLTEYRAKVRFSEASGLASTVEQIQQLNQVAAQIHSATIQWNVNQEQAAKTVATAREIADRIVAEAKAFSESLLKANDVEKNNLRLEVEKLHRSEADWLQTLVRILDHVYLLYQAGVRSGQANLRQQLGQFQNACRESARRVGLVPFEAQAGEPFNEQVHRLPDPGAKATSEAKVAETLATGFTYQGQLLRPILVSLQNPVALGIQEDSHEPAGPPPTGGS